MKCNVGDWVRFSRSGVLYIGSVEYITENKNFPYKLLVITTRGTLEEDEILEVRRPTVGEKQ